MHAHLFENRQPCLSDVSSNSAGKKKKKPKMYLNISNRSLTVHLSNKIVEKRFRDMINSLLVKYQSMN